VGAVVSRYDARAEIGQEDIERVVGLPVWSVLPSDYRRAVAAANVVGRSCQSPAVAWQRPCRSWRTNSLG